MSNRGAKHKPPQPELNILTKAAAALVASMVAEHDTFVNQ